MPSVIEVLTEKKAALQAELSKVEAEISEIPSKFHQLEAELWADLKGWFGSTTPAPTSEPIVPPAA